MSFLTHWLGQTNPNVVLPTLGLIATWLYHKVRGDKQASFGSLITSVIDNFMVELLDKYAPTQDVGTFMRDARKYLDDKLWVVLAKRGVPRNSLTERLTHDAIEKGVAWLGNEAAKRRIPVQLNELVSRLEKTKAILEQSNPAKAP